MSRGLVERQPSGDRLGLKSVVRVGRAAPDRRTDEAPAFDPLDGDLEVRGAKRSPITRRTPFLPYEAARSSSTTQPKLNGIDATTAGHTTPNTERPEAFNASSSLRAAIRP